MNLVTTKIFTGFEESTFLSTAALPLLDAMGENSMVAIDLFCAEPDYFIPSLGVMVYEQEKTYTPAGVPSDHRHLAAALLLEVDAHSTHLINLLEAWNSATKAAEEGYYIRIWINNDGLVAITPEDMDGWTNRVYDYAHTKDILVGRSFLLKDKKSGHNTLNLIPQINQFAKKITQAQSRTSGTLPYEFTKAEVSSWDSFFE